jgi:hypothetical protein
MPDDAHEKRRDERLRIKLPADLVRGKLRVTLLTEDVSFRGLFLRTDAPPAVRRLLQIEMLIPPDDRPLRLHGTVVHVLRPGETGARSPGMGIELVGLNGDVKSLWEGFVSHLRPRRKESIEVMQAARAAGVPDQVRRRFERYKKELRLLVDSVGELKTLIATDVSQGGMFVATELPLPIGHGFRVTVVHPESGATYPLDCVVKRRDVDSKPPGVGVQFDPMNDGQRQAFMEFIKDELPILSATEEDIDPALVDAWEEEEPTNAKPWPKK